MGFLAKSKGEENEIMKIILEKSKCIGCGSCAAICPKLFELGEDGKSHLKGSKINPRNQNEELEIQNIDCATQAVEVCPVEAIKIRKYDFS